MKTRLIPGEQLRIGPINAAILQKEGFIGAFASMKGGKLYLTNKRIILEGDTSPLGANFNPDSASDSNMEQSVRLLFSKNVIIPWEAISKITRGQFLTFNNVIRIHGDELGENGWRIIFQGRGFLKVVQELIDMKKWDDETPKMLKISRHLAD